MAEHQPPGPGRKPTSLTRDQQVRADCLEHALNFHAELFKDERFRGLGVLERADVLAEYVDDGLRER